MRRAGQEDVTGTEAMWAGLGVDEARRLGWGISQKVLCILLRGLYSFSSGESLGGFNQDTETRILITMY